MVWPLHARGAGKITYPELWELTPSQLAKAKVRHEPPAIRASARHAWLRNGAPSLSAARPSPSPSLLELRGGLGADSPTPSSSEVVSDDRISGW